MRVAPTKMAGGGKVAVPARRMRQIGPVGIAQPERHGDPHDRHRERGGADAEHLAQVGLQPDLEQQQQDAELGQDVDHLGRPCRPRDDAEHAAAEQDAGDQLAQDRGLAEALGQLARSLAATRMVASARNKLGDVEPRRRRDGTYSGSSAWGRSTKVCLKQRQVDGSVYSVWMVIRLGRRRGRSGSWASWPRIESA